LTALLSSTLAGLKHRPGRTILAALGTALGIATIVALLAVVGGAKHSAGDFVHLGASDLGLFQKDAADPTTSILSTRLIPSLRRTPGIADATPLVLLVDDIPRAPGAVAFGAPRDGFLMRRLVFTSGRLYRSGDEVVVGDQLAWRLHAEPGASLQVHHRTLRAVGIYHIGVAYQDSGVFMPLATAQAISGRQGEATTIPIKLAVGARPDAVKRTITQRFPGILVISDPEEATRAGANGQLVSNAALVIAVLALLIGGIGVMNTMLMSVVERRSEFALLSAVGWSAPQVAGRVLIEGVATALIGAGIGLLLGVVGAQLLVNVLGAQQFVAPELSAWDFGRALLVGVLIGVLGGLYPAWRAAQVSPAKVLAQH
jgi:putative ABC transport system permease protein